MRRLRLVKVPGPVVANGTRTKAEAFTFRIADSMLVRTAAEGDEVPTGVVNAAIPPPAVSPTNRIEASHVVVEPNRA